MDDIMDPELASKIECFLSRKREKYQLFDFDKSNWNGYGNKKQNILRGKLSFHRQ